MTLAKSDSQNILAEVRISAATARAMPTERLWQMLRERGLDPRTMTCREEGPVLVYRGVRIEQAPSKRRRGPRPSPKKE
jgi:hypothetical protein